MSPLAKTLNVRRRIPNIYHFVFGLRPQTKPFHLLHYLCLASCLAVNKPERLFVHLKNEPFGPLWDAIRPRIEVLPISDEDLVFDLPYADEFMRQYAYAHVADFVRLRILLRHGGVYADMDTIFVAPTPECLFDAPCVMGHERVVDDNTSGLSGSLCNALIMAEPQAEFIRLWLQRMPAAFDGSWSNHSTFLPFALATQHPELIRVEPEASFFALDWTAQGIADLFERDVPLPPGCFSLHLWAHLWQDFARRDFSRFSEEQLSPAYVAHAETTYARLARRFLPEGLAPSLAEYARETSAWEARLRSEAPAPDTSAAAAKPRAALLCAVVPDPHGVGLARRAYRWLFELSRTHTPCLFLLCDPQQPVPEYAFPVEVTRLGRPGSSTPRKLEDWIDLGEELGARLAELPGPVPDRVVVFRAYLHDVAQRLPVAWRDRAELDCDDWEAATRLSIARISLLHGRFREARRVFRNAVRYAWAEREIFRSYRVIYVSAAEDARRLRMLTGLDRFRAMPNSIIERAGFQPAPRVDHRTLLFVGALHYPPNDDALRWFGKSILPRLRDLLPDVRVIAAGRAEEGLQRRLARDGIEYVHAPADLVPLYAQAAVIIAPLRGGGGTKIKVLEAWQHQRALVATPHALRGLSARDGVEALVASTPAAFARACFRLLTDAEFSARLATNASALLRERYLFEAP